MSKMNLPNRLTIIRVILVPFVMLFILLNFKTTWWCDLAASVIFITAAVTDLLDGMMARKMNLVTNFGKFLDPIADKLLVFGTIFALIGSERFSDLRLALVIGGTLMLFRELAVTSIRMIATKQDGTVIAANFLGKLKTVISIVCLSAIILEDVIFPDIEFFNKLQSYHILPYTLIVLMVVLTLWSGYNYIRKYYTYIDPTI